METVDPPQSEAELLRCAVEMIAQRLPVGWLAELASEPEAGVDGWIAISDPAGTTARLQVEAKRVIEGRDVAILAERLAQAMGSGPDASGLVASRYLSPQVRSRLAEAGLAFVDATGNVRVQLSSPALYLADRGSDRDPWRGPGRPRGTLKGEPAAKVVRALVDFRGPWRMRRLKEEARTSTGAAYRVVEFLESEGLLGRDAQGLVTNPDWSQVLRRWSDDYGFVRTNAVTRWIAPRGLPGLMERIGAAASPMRYAVTGTIAAAQWSPYAPPKTAMIYVEDAAATAALWDLRSTDAGANVLLAEPRYDVVFERSTSVEGGAVVAAPSQVVVDLMTGPGRSPNEAEELLGWMQRNEGAWRG